MFIVFRIFYIFFVFSFFFRYNKHSSLGIARQVENDDRGWVWLGILTFTDPPRHDTKDTIEKANKLGVDVKMITGDQVAIVRVLFFFLLAFNLG